MINYLFDCRIIIFAAFSRFLVCSLQVFFNHIVPDHDADAFLLPHSKEGGLANDATSIFFEGFTRWDAQYFLHVALYGYTHENTLAFFPLYPLLLRISSSMIPASFGSNFNRTVLSGVFLNWLLFSLSAVLLYRLTLSVFQSKEFAHVTALLFCLNPASIFFSALYSESLFSVFVFGGLWALEKKRMFYAGVLLSLSTAVRSNGLLTAGFSAFVYVRKFAENMVLRKHKQYRTRWFHFVVLSIKMFVGILFVMLPFMLYQCYSYMLFCTSWFEDHNLPEIVHNYITRRDFKMPSEPSKWCYWKVPLSYSYVQSKYWNVGFLKYYTFKKIPNFLLALPAFLLVSTCSVKYLWHQKQHLLNFSILYREQSDTKDIYKSSMSLPYFLHSLFMVVFCWLFIHTEVITRMICSSSPVIYWITADILLHHTEYVKIKLGKGNAIREKIEADIRLLKTIAAKAKCKGKVIIVYFVGYLIVGTFLHCNFYPWT